MTPRPLPRTLAPLEDESLVGLILRLAQHTGSSPAVIATRMGLTDRVGIHVPAGSLLALPPQRLAEAAHVAGLSLSEMENLLLAPLGERYGPLSQAHAPCTGLNSSLTPGDGSTCVARSSASAAWPEGTTLWVPNSVARGRGTGTCRWSSSASSTAARSDAAAPPVGARPRHPARTHRSCHL